MKYIKAVTQIEKFIEKLNDVTHDFEKPENQTEFDSNKKDVITLLNDMIELAQDDAGGKEEDEPEEE